MSNENTKIIIQEVDQTKPRGSGSSSDIPYIPGFSAKSDAAQNMPILCNSVQEFEAAFGTEPYVLEHKDVCALDASLSSQYHVGDKDRSYIYAKELLNAGMSVMYENISSKDDSSIVIASGVNTDSKILDPENANTFKITEVTIGGEAEQTFTFNLTDLAKGKTVTLLIDEEEKDIIDFDSIIVDTGSSSLEVAPLTEGDKSIQKITRKSDKSADEQTIVTVQFIIKVPTAALVGSHIFVTVAEGIVTEALKDHNGSSKIQYLYDTFEQHLNALLDKNEYSVKYITSGGYPMFINFNKYALAQKMLDTAANRGDAVALIDHLYLPDAPLEGKDSVFAKVQEIFRNANNTEYGAMFTNYGTYTCPTVLDQVILPGSFGYLMCVADTIKSSYNWLAIAGVSRGRVPNIVNMATNKVLTNVIAENYQPKYGSANVAVSVNGITNIRPYGLCVWGNRTLKPVAENGTVATNFLNVRNMLSDIKKVAYSTAKSLMFEQDSDSLWLRFKSGVSPLLEQLKSGNGIEDYKLIRTTTKFNGNSLTRGEMACTIKVKPRYAIEYMEITVAISDEDVAVA